MDQVRIAAVRIIKKEGESVMLCAPRERVGTDFSFN
jgi:hypothetical protein